MRAQGKLPVLAFLALLTTGCPGPEVVRIVDGVPTPGRFVSASAYAAFIQASEREARGDIPGAIAAYGSAIDRDADSVLPWVRMGELRCLQGEATAAAEAFAEAETRAPRFEPLWRARARCALSVGESQVAVEAAQRAVAERPRRVETVVLLARTLAATDRRGEAMRHLVSLAVQYPQRAVVWLAIRDIASEPAWVARAEARLADLHGHAAHEGAPPTVPNFRRTSAGWSAVDRALHDGELDVARRAMRRAKLDHRLLAARALLVGEAKLALQEAELRLAAHPEESDARVAFALAADLVQNDAALARALGPLPSTPEALSPSGRILMAELLARRAGPDAAAAWTDGPADLSTLRRRLAEVLAAAR